MAAQVAKLRMEDGSVYAGRAFGASGEKFGEVVFNTSMTGYQEVLTDPSYTGQIVCMSYPLIGNYGVNLDNHESPRPRSDGFIVRERSPVVGHYRATGDLESYLHKHGIIGIEGIDTRALVRRLRVHGAMTGVLSTVDLDNVAGAEGPQHPNIVGRDLVREVVPEGTTHWDEGFTHPLTTYLQPQPPSAASSPSTSA